MNKFSKFSADVICELHPLFKGLLWVSSARSNDETRYILQMIHVEREGMLYHIVATDGRRLHVHTFDPGMFDDDIATIEAGMYEVIAKTGKLIVIAPPSDPIGTKYPNWRAIVPDESPKFEDAIGSSTVGKMGIRTGVLLAVDFARDAIGFGKGRGKDDTALVKYGPSGDSKGAFIIEHDLGKAYVMPVRMSEDDEDEEAPKDDTEATPQLTGLDASPAVEKAVKDFVKRTQKGMKVGESVTISMPNGPSATIHGTAK